VRSRVSARIRAAAADAAAADAEDVPVGSGSGPGRKEEGNRIGGTERTTATAMERNHLKSPPPPAVGRANTLDRCLRNEVAALAKRRATTAAAADDDD
jgi:hypothetical protein